MVRLMYGMRACTDPELYAVNHLVATVTGLCSMLESAGLNKQMRAQSGSRCWWELGVEHTVGIITKKDANGMNLYIPAGSANNDFLRNQRV